MVSFFRYTYINGKTKAAVLVISIFLMATCCAIVYLKGIMLIFWYYPAVVAVYYLLEPLKALFISFFSVIALAGILFSTTDNFVVISILISCFIMNLILYSAFKSYHKVEHKLIKLATIDELTGVGNRRYLTQKLFSIESSQRQQFSNATIAMFDLDYFKKINDEHGHAVGDKVLKEVAEIISANTRSLDHIFRYGGEEFIIVFQKLNSKEVFHISEKLRNLIASTELSTGITVTVSIGLAQNLINETIDDWLLRADTALYEAKKGGRNMIVVS